MKTTQEVTADMIIIGQRKAALPTAKMLVLAILAGAYVALAAIGSTTAQATVQNPSVAKLISACIFPAGLAMVLLAGAELFTGNSLMVMALMDKKITLPRMLRNWGLVYIGNMLGALVVALLVVYSHTLSLFGGQLSTVTAAAAVSKTSLSFGDALFRGILCNLLVCLGVWMGCAAKSAGGKVAALFYPVMLFVVCGFEHCVANMYYIPVALLMQAAGQASTGITLGSYLLVNLLPVTLGNILGGTALGAAYYAAYGQRA